ncbi:iron-sulfur cluster assembly protein [Actinomadura barringtoniae]|uniref:Iron-sulfur cluster assembly protein n=1 Tax=Actinomadura barringtoniae TaxID=1427535 RepID=A0A939PJ01_9ACTN|nr:iron-sulfur cluster assembly protein [Actinomadura barringtoniae]MBO2453792.1 iron-sulfur cluster assembly protein [Actinomadura barringtoniae]
MTDARVPLREAVWEALGTVRDPELDEPITELGFAAATVTRAGAARVRLRLPTYFCAPNFAYLMVADARDAVAGVPGVTEIDVRLEDHFAAEEINAGVATESGFADAFPGLADGELAALRLTFQRKAHLAAIERACRVLADAGRSVKELGEARLGDLPDSAARTSLLRRRTDLGLPTGPDERLLVDDEGRPVEDGLVAGRIRFAQAVRVSIEGNSGFCRGLLKTRYPDRAQTEEGETVR